MSQTVIGFFDNQSEAQQAVEQLERTGISRDRIDISKGNTGSAASASSSTQTGNSDRTTSDGRTVDEKGRNTNKITDFFNSLFGGSDKDDDAKRFGHVAERSECIVTVHAQNEDEAERAADILDDCGAVDVDERASQYGYAAASGTTDRDLERGRTSDADQTIERVQENLEVGKREVERGSTRIRSRIVERPIEEHVRLREEHIRIEHQPVNRPASEADLNSLRDQNIELTERAEVPVVNKEARVVEEIRVSKDVEERDETIRDTVRNTEIDIDQNNDLNNKEDRRGTGDLRSGDL
ncbi:MAG TPA: YsnF/AvaK domain-containing protein [Flavisolibacter sp.]|nr:YsnF/AvaK domain-containing protein [Flavisolibacter sp.]